MTTDSWSSYILTLVTFAPLVGALLLVMFPRRDRDIRIFALVFSLLTFLLSLHLPVHFHRGARRDSSTKSIASGSPLPTFTTTWAWTASPCGWWC